MNQLPSSGSLTEIYSSTVELWTRISASFGMDVEWESSACSVESESSACRPLNDTPGCLCRPWQAWIRNTLGLAVRGDWGVAMKGLVICLIGRGSPSVPNTTPLFPWLRTQQMKASPCWGASGRSVNSLRVHSLTLNSCSWERSHWEAKHFSARSIWSLVWSLHISTLNPSQLNTSAKLSAVK